MECTRTRIHPRFYLFREKGFFIDCTLATPCGTIKCHKLVLARHSSYFKDRFFDGQDDGIVTINLEFDPNNALSAIVDFLYTTVIEVNATNIIDLAAVASCYGFEDIEALLMDRLPQKITFENSLYMMRKMVEYDLNSMIDNVIPFYAENFERYDREKILEAMNPHAFAGILINENFPSCFSEDEILEMIDMFYRTGKELTDEDRMMFSRAVDFEKESSFQWMLKHGCDWLPFSFQRRLANEILDRRRAVIAYFDRELETVQEEKVSRWFALQRLSGVADAKMIDEVNAIYFFSTFSSMINFVNPVKFGFMQLDTSKSLVKYFSGHFIFDIGGYFAALKIGNEYPWIDFGLGQGVKFKITGLEFRMPEVDVDRKNKIKKKRPYPGTVEVVLRGDNECRFLDRDTMERIDIDFPDAVNHVLLRMVEPNSAGGWIFRLSIANIYGSFVG